MRITLLVSEGDAHLLPEWVAIHRHLKNIGASHSLHIISPPSVLTFARDAKNEIAGCFEAVAVHEMQQEPYGAWPLAPNMQFYAAADFMYRDNPGVPWFLCELDCRPIRANAYDMLASRYASCGVPFFGSMDKTPWRETEPFLYDNEGNQTQTPNPKYGKIIPSKFGDSDLMMSGCAVYPGDLVHRKDFGSKDGSSGLMADFIKGTGSITDPWDIHLRGAMKAHGMSHTSLLGQYWNTVNYRVENGRLVCDSRKSHEFFDRNPTFTMRECGGIVHPDAVLIHGCKDDSLARLILADAIPEIASMPMTATISTAAAAQGAAATVTPQDDSRIKALEQGQSAIMDMLSKLLSKDSPKPNDVQGEPATAVPVVAVHETTALPSILKKIDELLPQGKSIRLGDLAKKVGMKPQQLESLLNSSATFLVKAPGWVQRRAA